jgi:capsular polysaccharide biosynthesis protein
MEQHLIARLMARKWWIFLVVLLVTVGATLLLTMRQTPIYRAKATYVNRLSEITDTKTISTALDTLNRYDNLQGTYSEIAMSQVIKDKAGSKMGLSNTDLRNFSVSSRTVPGSRILEITVEGQDPELVSDFAGVVGEETMAYVNDLYPSYQLALLDAPATSNRPVSPRLTFNLVLGIILGAFLGFTALLLSSWLRGDFKNAPAIQSVQDEPGELQLQPVRRELELLLQQCEQIRSELNETREVIQNTESQAKTVHTMLDTMSKNGHSS